jgi:hypothetical protein
MNEDQKTQQNDEIEKVLKFIKKSGYPFEARIARAFANYRVDEDWIEILLRDYDPNPIPVYGALNPRVSVKCGVPYFDETEKKPRELDLQAVLALNVLGSELKINFLVQCKNTSRWWVFCHYGFETTPTIYRQYWATGLELRKDKPVDVLMSLFSPHPVIGKERSSLCSSAKVMVKEPKDNKKDENKDEIWEACITAIKATRYAREVAQRTTRLEGTRELSLFVPMVATGNHIYQVDLSGESAEAERVEFAYYSHQTLAEDGLTYEHYPIPIVSEASLSQVLNTTAVNATEFLLNCFTLQM